MVAKIALKLFKIVSGRFLEGFGKLFFFKSCHGGSRGRFWSFRGWIWSGFGASRGGFGVDLEPPGMLKFNISADSFLLT